MGASATLARKEYSIFASGAFMNRASQSSVPRLDRYISVPGRIFGYRTACVIMDVHRSTISTAVALQVGQHVLETLRQLDPLRAPPVAISDKQADPLAQVVYWIYLCALWANVPLVEAARIVGKVNGEDRRIVIPAPVAAHQRIVELVSWLIGLFGEQDLRVLKEEIARQLPVSIGRLQTVDPVSSNVPHFLAAAQKLDVPVDLVCGSVLQFGFGKKSCWLDSSFTDKTSTVAASIARKKHLAAKVMHDAGLPVPPQAIAATVDDALNIADRLGYPVVVKPADRDGGLAVAADLARREDVVRAFEEARRCSSTILVEKHIPGRDYRLTVFNGELVAAIERIPAGVIGDGKRRIDELLDVLNADPRRSDGVHAKLKKIALDDEARNLLEVKGMTPASVPARGDFIQLRRRANVSSGGMPVAVLDKVHPENRRLAIRAAAALGLDLAGVDFLTPDISRSWMEAGGAICEINAQPQLGSITSPHIYGDILKRLLAGDGRIPIALVFGDTGERVAGSVAAGYANAGLTVGVAGRNGVFVGAECITREPLSLYRAGRILIRHRSVDAIVIEVNEFSVLRTGLPFDRFEKMIIAGRSFRAEKDGSELALAEIHALLHSTIEILSPACAEVIEMCSDKNAIVPN